MTSHYYKFGAILNNEQSSALSFIGVMEPGNVISVITKDGVEYRYQLPEKITLKKFKEILRGSVGRYWVEELKKHRMMHKEYLKPPISYFIKHELYVDEIRKPPSISFESLGKEKIDGITAGLFDF